METERSEEKQMKERCQDLVIFGSRDFKSELHYELLCSFMRCLPYRDLVAEVCGMCEGADLLGKRWAENDATPKFEDIIEMPAKWGDLEGVDPKNIRTRKDGTRYNVLAGYERNELMAQEAEDGVGVACWDGASRGTKDMMTRCEKHGIEVFPLRFDTPSPSVARGELIVCSISQLKDVQADVKINIARKDINSPGILHRPVMAPSVELFQWYRAQVNTTNQVGAMPAEWWPEYRTRFIDEHHLAGPYTDKITDITVALAQGAKVAIACFCGDTRFCHRRLVAADIHAWYVYTEKAPLRVIYR